MRKNKQRFIITEINHDAMASCTKILVDTQTKVQYIFHNEGSAAGMCLLVDEQGKPLLASGEICEHPDIKHKKPSSEYVASPLNQRLEQEPIQPMKKVIVKKKEKISWADRIKKA